MHILTAIFRTQLIDALSSANSKTFLSSPSETTSLPVSPLPSPELSSLQHSNYPNVKHWTRKRGDKSQVTVITVVDAGSESGPDNENLGSDDSVAGKEDGIPAFLENEDGSLITYEEKKQLYLAMRGWWNDNIGNKNPPGNWSSVGETLRNSFRDFLERRFFCLRLCSQRWKVDELWKRNYHSWLRSFKKKINDLDRGSSNKHSSDEDTCDEVPKKKKRNRKSEREPNKWNTDKPKKKKQKTVQNDIPTKAAAFERKQADDKRASKGNAVEKVTAHFHCRISVLAFLQPTVPPIVKNASALTLSSDVSLR